MFPLGHLLRESPGGDEKRGDRLPGSARPSRGDVRDSGNRAAVGRLGQWYTLHASHGPSATFPGVAGASRGELRGTRRSYLDRVQRYQPLTNPPVKAFRPDSSPLICDPIVAESLASVMRSLFGAQAESRVDWFELEE